MYLKVMLVISSVLISGCTAVLARTTDFRCPYLGVRIDWNLAKDNNGVLWPLLAIDAPFSAVVDTVFLPFELQHSCNL